MKVVCDRAAVLDALGMASSVVTGRTPSPILHCVKLVADGGRLSIAATDSEIAVRIGVAQVDVQDDGEALVPADKLVQIVRASEDATLTLHAQKQALHIKGADSHFKVLGFDPKEYPPIKDFPEGKADCVVNAAQFRRLVTRTLFATAVENSRYAINGVLFERSGASCAWSRPTVGDWRSRGASATPLPTATPAASSRPRRSTSSIA